jgi:predicted transposase YdaD
MSLHYDATSKLLIEIAPEGWVTLLGQPRTSDQVELVDSDLSTVSASADKVIRVNDPTPWILHLEFQTGSDSNLPRRLLRYNALLQEVHELEVASVVVLLRKEANSTRLTGNKLSSTPVGPDWNFGYRVIRVWERSPDEFLQSSLALAPLAPIANIKRDALPELIDKLRQRIEHQQDLEVRGRLWTATKVLMGLKYDDALTEILLQGVMGMEDSVTYQAMVRRATEKGMREGLQAGRQEGLLAGRQEGVVAGLSAGRAIEARSVIRRIGTRQLGPIPVELSVKLEAIADPDQLDSLIDRVLVISSWKDLLSDS